MRAADLDEVMEIERLSFPNPWGRQIFIEELEREGVFERPAGR